MKKLISLVLVLAVSSVASALSGNVIENFETYTVGEVLSSQGWTMTYEGTTNPIQDAQVIVGVDGTKSIMDDYPPRSAYYYQGTRDALFTPLPGGFFGDSHMAMTLVPNTYDTTFGIQRNDGYPGPIIGTNGGGQGNERFTIQAALWGPQYTSTDIATTNHAYDVVMNMTTATAGSTTYGTLYYRDLTAGGPWTMSSLQNIDLGNPYWMPLYDRLYVRGAFYGEQDDLAFGPGHVAIPEPATLCLLALGGLLLRKRS